MEATRRLSDLMVDEPVAEPAVDAEKAEPVRAALPAASGDDVPDWVVIPKDLRIPKGRQVFFLRFPATMTDTPLKGERQAIVWTLTDGDERLANDRCEGRAARASTEYTKQMIRAVDGSVATFMRPSGPGSVDEFWREIGGKGRNLLMQLYSRLHLASDEETQHFFENCIAVRTAG